MQDHEREARDHELMLWRRMKPADKYRQMLALLDMARRYKAAGLRALHPEWSPDQVDQAVREAFLCAST